MRYIIEIPGPPVGKQRPRVAMRGTFPHMYTPKETVTYEDMVKVYARKAIGPAEPIETPCAVKITAFMPIPASWSFKKRNQAIAGELFPTVKPDADNVSKICLDAMNEIVYRDDAQVVTLMVRKLYSENPRVLIEVDHEQQAITAGNTSIEADRQVLPR